MLQAAVLVLWLGSFLLARVLEHAPHASLWFPPAAVTLAALLVVGLRALPAILLACAAATFVTELRYAETVRPGVLVASSVAFALTHSAAYGVPALLLRRHYARRPSDVTLATVSRFILLGMVGAALAALGGVLGLSATGLIETDAPGRLMAAWWMGDFVAVLTLSPLFIRWIVRAVGAAGAHGAARFSPFQSDPVPGSRAAALKLAAMAAATVAMLAAAHALEERVLLLAVMVVPLVLQLWVVHSENRTAALRGVVLFSLITVGAGALFETTVDVVALQFAAIGLAVNTYFGLAVPALYASHERLREQVTRDRLTRVMTRAYFEDRAAQELERAKAEGRPVAVILFDLDGLKAINDTHGHAVGDAVLAELAARCATSLRPGDLLGRLSGDEFAVFLPDADAATADAMIARMRAALDAPPFPGPVGRVSASFGRAVGGATGDTCDGLLRQADQAMYADKRRARDRVANAL
ncbi:MAG TPA: diguanylate cyclase [Lysobacter sp.]|nr:diguanylate cyclase [Lysobacter sp.]